MNWYYIAGNGSQTAAGDRGVDPDSMTGTATMYDALTGSILTLGGSPDYQDSNATSSAHVITLGAPPSLPSVTRITDASFARAFANAVVLPNGQTLIVGGQSYAVPFTDTTAIQTPELFDPTTQKFTNLTPNSIPRTYHSIAILLPDATVFTGGGGLCGNCKTNHANAEIFYPPYLYLADGTTLAPRPSITSISASTVKVGGKLTVIVKNSIEHFSLVRMGSTTHTVNTDQRRIEISGTVDGLVHYLNLPADAGVLLPGYWMLFAIDGAGTPSLAWTLKITL